MDENPEKRMTVEQALNHPWVTRYLEFFSATIDSLDRTNY